MVLRDFIKKKSVSKEKLNLFLCLWAHVPLSPLSFYLSLSSFSLCSEVLCVCLRAEICLKRISRGPDHQHPHPRLGGFNSKKCAKTKIKLIRRMGFLVPRCMATLTIHLIFSTLRSLSPRHHNVQVYAPTLKHEDNEVEEF